MSDRKAEKNKFDSILKKTSYSSDVMCIDLAGLLTKIMERITCFTTLTNQHIRFSHVVELNAKNRHTHKL